MNTKIKTKVFRRKDYIDFLANCKNSIIEKQSSRGVTLRIDQVDIITKSGDFRAGELINTIDCKYSINTEAVENCNYIIKKTSDILTETNIERYEYIYIYEGGKNDEKICNKLGISKSDEFEIYNDPDAFIQQVINKKTTYIIEDKEFVQTTTNEVIYGNKESILIGEENITVARDTFKGIIRNKSKNLSLLMPSEKKDLCIKQTITMSLSDDKERVRYIFYTPN